jgi:uncharacterized protein
VASVTILDANVLVYAYKTGTPQHDAASRWLSRLLASGEVVGLPWVTLWAFLRVCTNTRLWEHPTPAGEVWAVIREWLEQPGIVVPQAGPQHAQILEKLMTDRNVSGPMVTDAGLAALAIEQGATLASTDQDFRRFPEVRWVNPLEVQPS